MGRGRPLTMEDAKRVIAVAVADPQISMHAMEKIVGRDESTCRKLVDRYQGLINEYRRIKTPQVVEEIDSLRRGYLAQLADPEVITACSGPQAAVVFGILTDKMLLESGRPTSINLTATVDATMPDLLSRLKRALEGRASTRSSVGSVETSATTQSGQQEGT